MRNDVVHGKGTTTIMFSVNFLIGYEETLKSISRPLTGQCDKKRKGKVNEGAGLSKPAMHGPLQRERKRAVWLPPPAG
jgi:hypothetical protein